jgi:acetyltransferase-like isoleucine patch superfamily enzyme
LGLCRNTEECGYRAASKISSHTFTCEGVTIEDDVFVGHGVVFINDPYPRATIDGRLQTEADWKGVPTRVARGASIGSGAEILCGVTIGEEALVGAGAVVTGMSCRVRLSPASVRDCFAVERKTLS